MFYTQGQSQVINLFLNIKFWQTSDIIFTNTNDAHQALSFEEDCSVSLSKEKCVGCYLCNLICPVNVISIGEIYFRNGNKRDIII